MAEEACSPVAAEIQFGRARRPNVPFKLYCPYDLTHLPTGPTNSQ